MNPGQTPSHLADIRVGGKFRFGRKIGSGSFGEIYLGMVLTSVAGGGGWSFAIFFSS